MSPSRSFVQKTGRSTQPRSKALQPAPQTAESEKADQQEAAEYIAHITAELADIAASAQLDLVGYFLKMAQIEAAAAWSRLSDKRNTL